MWFLLSLNLSHWIGSFSTVGLYSHLGFRQKGLREANHFTFFILERRREKKSRECWREERVGTFFEGACWRDFEWAQISRSLYCCTETEVCTACIYCWHENWEVVRQHLLPSVLYGFGHGFQGKSRHSFWGGYTTFPKAASCICWHRNRGRTTALNAVHTVRILRMLAQFSRADICWYFWHVFQEGFAQKLRQQ